MRIPKILDNDMFLKAPIKYKWNEDTSSFYYVDAENEKISYALWKLNHKATYGIATSLCEWIYWRMSRYINRPLALQSIEAQWASILDRRYSIDWNFDGDYISEPINGPIYTMLKILQLPRECYYEGSIFIDDGVEKLAMLARHISPDKKFFDQWFNNNLRNAVRLFPAQYDRDGDLDAYEDKIYDSSQEPVIPREFFFDPDYNYEAADNEKLINQFLASLNYKENVLLNSPEDMLNIGFVGKPYQC